MSSDSDEPNTPSSEVRVAVVQRPPVLLQRDPTLAAAVSHLGEAAEHGARLVVFPEAYIPGYPVWVWALRPGGDYELSAQIHELLLGNSIDLGADELRPLQDAAAEHEVVVVCGIHERDARYGGGTLYNTLVTIGPDGSILNRHRKLVPTNPERMVWGHGDAVGLRVVTTSFGRIGGLICWENYMPLARFALYAGGVEVYVASTWDSGETWIAGMRHIAAEGRCWVIGSGCSLRNSDVPGQFPDRQRLFPEPDEWLNPGDSVIVAPGGAIIAGPLHNEHGILYGDIQPSVATRERRTLDVSGHYARNDIFQLTVNRTEQAPIVFNDA